MRQQQRLAHKTLMTHQTLVRFLITVNVSMRIPIVAAVECFAAYLACEWLIAGMDAYVLFVMLRIDERRVALVAFVWPFAGVRCLDMVFEQPTAFERSIARFAFVSFVVEMGGSFV